MIRMSKYTTDKEWFSPATLDKIISSGASPKWFIDKRLLDFVDQIREHFGKPIILNQSKQGLIRRGFRTAKENEDLKGATFSQHLYGRAADINVVGIPDKEVAEYARSIGVPYVLDEPGWTHIDVRNVL